MELSDDTPVTLVIKAPSQRMDDQEIDCVPSWTVRKLKEHLETVYPTRPKYNEQRLIYSGRLLQDQLTLKEILRQYDSSSTSNRYTLHLVCSSTSESQPISKTSDTPKQAVTNTVTTTAASTRPEVNSVPASDSSNIDSVSAGTSPPTPPGDGLRHRGSQPVNTSTATNPGAYFYPGYYSSAYNPYMTAATGSTLNGATGEGNMVNSQHYAMMMQQMYSQYMMQYAQFYQIAYNPAMLGAQPASPVGQPWFQPYPPHLQREELRPQAAEAAVADGGGNREGAAPRQNIRMNAQGGMEEDEDDDGEPRDWLHHTYFMMRVLTFVGILFFYSNLTRFLVVFSGGFVVYFLLKLRKYMQQRERELQQLQRQEQEQRQEQQPQQPQQEQEENVPPNVQQNNEEVHENVEPQATTERDQIQANDQVEEEEGGRVARLFLFACNTVQAFFTSLLPNPPELLDPN